MRRWGLGLAAALSPLVWMLAGPVSAEGRLTQGMPRPAASRSSLPLPAEVQAKMERAVTLKEQGAYTEAAAIWQTVLEWAERTLGPSDLSTAAVLNNLADNLHRSGSLTQAEPLYRRALAIVEATSGSGDSNLAITLNNLANLYREQGRLGEAEVIYLRALSILEKSLGPNHPATAMALNNLAVLYRQQGLFTKASPLAERSLRITHKAYGPHHPETARALNNLAVLFTSQGDWPQAERFARPALALYRETLGPAHPTTASALGNLAEILREQGKLAEAETLAQQALAMKENVLGADHPETIRSLSNLAAIVMARGEPSRAEPYAIQAVRRQKRSATPNQPQTALYLNALAAIEWALGAPKKAEPLYRQALELNTANFGAEHPNTFLFRTNLASMLATLGDITHAEPLLRQGIYGQTLFLQREIPLLPESRRLWQLQSFGNTWEIVYTYAGRNVATTDLALFTRLNRQGLLQEIEQRQALLARSPGPQQELSQQIASLTNRLADVNLSPPQRQALQQQLGDVEKQLYRLLPALQPHVVEPGEVARVLPTDGVLVEFQRYRPFDSRQPTGKSWGEPRYLALLLFPDGRIASQDLGLASGVEPLIRSALKISEKGEQSPNEAWVQVRDMVFPPALLSQLKDRKQWFLSPDGELSRIPFAALPAPETLGPGQSPRWLAQVVRLRLITSGRDLLPKPRAPQVNAGQALVIANPEFGAPGTPWAPLRATASEGQEIAAQLKATLLTGEQATATALQRIKGPRLLHVASHGFFSDPQPSAQPAAIAPQRLGSRSAAFSGPPASTGDPLLNSGIVLSGANRHRRPAQGGSAQAPAASTPDGDDDGYLTAKEASRLQLEGTELVVLSACDTASGVSQSGEGVYGLQRALTVAGARTTLLSLWKVDDEATAFFMQRYYTLLKAGKGRQEALVQVQEEFRSTPKHKEWKDYRYWAAWQLTGDGAPLPGL